jgi:hypothetical protein
VYAGKRSLGVEGTCKRLTRGSSVIVSTPDARRGVEFGGSPLRWAVERS